MKNARSFVIVLALVFAGTTLAACDKDGGGREDADTDERADDVPIDDALTDDAVPDDAADDDPVSDDTVSDDTSSDDVITDDGEDGSVPPPAYSPMVVEDFEEGSDEQDAGWPATTGGPMAYDTERSSSGATSIRVTFRHGENGYGGYRDMPLPVGPGETVWYRVRLYLPTTLSLSYGDVSGDGFGWNKFLVMARLNHESPRMYVQPSSPYKVDYGQPGFYGTGLYVNHDGLGDAYCVLEESSYSFPRDRWFALQMAWSVAADASAWIRVWSDETFVGECAGAGQVPAGYEVQSWGIGDYWNGGAWIQGGSTGDFWLDDVVVTVETPSTTDDGGRPFIHPDHF